jgi:AraC-like DNA-binding protein
LTSSLLSAFRGHRQPPEKNQEIPDLVRARLAEGDIALPRVARTLGVSPRTLQRRPEERGVEYQGLVDDIRCREALRLVGASDAPLVEVGFLLGYSDPKAFRRAFRRWTGVSPAELRRGADRRGPGTAGVKDASPDSRSRAVAEAAGGSSGTRVAARPWSI